jgi:sortase A
MTTAKYRLTEHFVQIGWRNVEMRYAIHTPRPVFLGALAGVLLACLLLAGCGGRQAREAEAATMEDAPVQEAARSDDPEMTVIEGEGPAAPVAPASFSHIVGQSQTPTRLTIPAIELDTPVVELGWSTKEDEAGNIFSEWNVAEYAAGWHLNSATLGDGGNVVMSGHNNIAGAVFRELDQLKQGNEMFVYAGNTRHTYVIEKVLIVPDKLATPEQRRENAKWIGDFDDDRLTLVSCWPRDDNTHRIIVVGHRQGAITASASN